MMSVEESSSLESDTCTSPACIRAAARLLARLDPSTDPCTDFYKFSCGRFLETYSVPDDSNQLSTLQEMQDEMLLSTRSKVPCYISYKQKESYLILKKKKISQL